MNAEGNSPMRVASLSEGSPIEWRSFANSGWCGNFTSYLIFHRLLIGILIRSGPDPVYLELGTTKNP